MKSREFSRHFEIDSLDLVVILRNGSMTCCKLPLSDSGFVLNEKERNKKFIKIFSCFKKVLYVNYFYVNVY